MRGYLQHYGFPRLRRAQCVHGGGTKRGGRDAMFHRQAGPLDRYNFSELLCLLTQQKCRTAAEYGSDN